MNLRNLLTLFFLYIYIKGTSNFGAEAELSYIFCDLGLKTFLRCS